MASGTVALGAFMISAALVIAVIRQARPDLLTKLAGMKKTWGDGPGLALHVVAYTILPLVSGAVFVFAGLRGISIF